MLWAFLTGHMHKILIEIVSQNFENHALSQKILAQETRFAETKIFFAPLALIGEFFYIERKHHIVRLPILPRQGPYLESQPNLILQPLDFCFAVIHIWVHMDHRCQVIREKGIYTICIANII